MSSTGTTSRIDYTSLIAALEIDANAVADEYSPDLEAEPGLAAPATPTDTAMWHDDDEYKAWAKQQRRRLSEPFAQQAEHHGIGSPHPAPGQRRSTRRRSGAHDLRLPRREGHGPSARLTQA